MGFDDVDRRFQPKQPLKLECIECGEPRTDVEPRDDWSQGWIGDARPCLCRPCWEKLVPSGNFY